MEVIHLILLFIENGLVFAAEELFHGSVLIIGLILAIIFSRIEIHEDAKAQKGIVSNDDLR